MQFTKNILQFCLLAIINLGLLSPVSANTLQEAQEAIDKKEYSTAIIYLKNQLKESPKNAQARFLLGSVYLQTGKLDSSIKELQRAHEYAPNDTEILFRYSDALQASGKFKKIISTLNKPLPDNQRESQRLSYIGYAHLGLKQIADAKQFFEKSNQLHKNVMAFNGLASLAMVEKEFSEAEQLVADSLALEPDKQTTLQLKAKLANLTKQHEQALALYNQLIESNDDNLTYRLERAATFAILKQDQQAKNDLKVVLDKVKNHPQAQFIMAQILLRERDYDGARAAAQEVLNVIPQHMPAAFIFGATNYALKNYNQAVEYLIIYLSADPTNLKAQNLLANVYLEQQKYRQALLLMESIPEQQVNKDPLLLLTLGSIYLRTGNNKKGLELLSQAQKLAPDNQEVRKRLIAAQLQSGELGDAISELEQLASKQGTTAETQEQTNFLLITSYLKQKEFEKASDKINELLAKKPKDTDLLNLNALTEQLKGNTQKATKEYQNIIKQDKDNIPAHMGLARIAAIEQNWPQAETYFKKIISINPDTIKAYLGLAVVADKQKNPLMTEKYFLDAIVQSKNDIQAQVQIAQLLSQWYQAQKKPEKILSLAKKLEQQDPNNKTILSFLAKAQILNKQNTQAERTLNRIISIDKKTIEHRILLAQLLSQEPDRINQALDLLNDALSVEPDNLTAYTVKAAILVKNERYEDAIDIANNIQQEFPESSTGQLLEADIYRAQKKYEKALTIYQQVYQHSPDKKILSASVDILIKLEQNDKAIQMLTKAVENDPDDIDSLLKLASLHHQLQQLEKAEQYYNRILKTVPNNIVTLNNLAWIYMEKDSNKALKLAKQAHEQTPETAAIIDTYGYALVKVGKYQEGLELLKKAETSLPKDKDVQYHLAYTYEKTGQPDKAIAILETITNSNETFSERDNAKRLYKKLK